MNQLWKPDKATRSAIKRGDKRSATGKRQHACASCERMFNTVGNETVCWSCYVRTRAPT